MRRPRLRVADAPFHVIQRGNNRSACFISDVDRLRYLAELADCAERQRVAIHAYVLMTNHVHLLVTPSTEDGVIGMMKGLGERYVPWFNRRHGRTGTLWDGRFRTCLIDSESYLLTCHRYIECNPVRAEMVRRPEDYAWSSHRANAFAKPDRLVRPHPVYQALGNSEEDRCLAYREMFVEDVPAEALELIRLGAARGLTLLGSRP